MMSLWGTAHRLRELLTGKLGPGGIVPYAAALLCANGHHLNRRVGNALNKRARNWSTTGSVDNAAGMEIPAMFRPEISARDLQ